MKPRNPSNKAAAAVSATAAPTTAQAGGSGVSASPEIGGTAPSSDVVSQPAPAGIAPAPVEGDASLAPVTGAKAGEGPEPVINPPSGIDATVAPATASPAASLAATLDAVTPSAATVAASLAAPVLSGTGAVLGGVVSGELWKETVVDTGTDDLRAGEFPEPLPIGRTIMVRSVSDRGRRRAGISFGPVPQRVEVDKLTEQEIEGLLGDPQLVVSLDD